MRRKSNGKRDYPDYDYGYNDDDYMDSYNYDEDYDPYESIDYRDEEDDDYFDDVEDGDEEDTYEKIYDNEMNEIEENYIITCPHCGESFPKKELRAVRFCPFCYMMYDRPPRNK